MGWFNQHPYFWLVGVLPGKTCIKKAALEVPPEEVRNHKALAQE
jgi:hypothetical protein